MRQCRTLHVNECAVPTRVHDFQDKSAAIAGYEMEIAVIFPRQRTGVTSNP